MLKDELKQVPSSAPALAFLATIIKDYGAVDESVQLYKDASTLKPDNTSYVLNLVHGYELLNNASTFNVASATAVLTSSPFSIK